MVYEYPVVKYRVNIPMTKKDVEKIEDIIAYHGGINVVLPFERKGKLEISLPESLEKVVRRIEEDLEFLERFPIYTYWPFGDPVSPIQEYNKRKGIWEPYIDYSNGEVPVVVVEFNKDSPLAYIVLRVTRDLYRWGKIIPQTKALIAAGTPVSVTTEEIKKAAMRLLGYEIL